MNKILPLLLLCFLCSACEKVHFGDDSDHNSDYRFEVSCNSCNIEIDDGVNYSTYHVQGYQSIPYNHTLPVLTLSLWTDSYDDDATIVTFVGSGYNRTVFNDYLYYGDPDQVVQINL